MNEFSCEKCKGTGCDLDMSYPFYVARIYGDDFFSNMQKEFVNTKWEDLGREVALYLNSLTTGKTFIKFVFVSDIYNTHSCIALIDNSMSYDDMNTAFFSDVISKIREVLSRHEDINIVNME